MKLNLKIEGDRLRGSRYGAGYDPQTEIYTVAEIAGAEGSNKALAGILRALADDIAPPYHPLDAITEGIA